MPKGRETRAQRAARYLRLQRLIEREIASFIGATGTLDDVRSARDDAIANADPRIIQAGIASGILDKILKETFIPVSPTLSVQPLDEGFRVRNSRTGKTRDVREVRIDRRGRYRDERGRFV